MGGCRKGDKQIRAKRPILARSIRGLARKMGKAESTVRKWISREDWAFGLVPPWDVARVKAWAEIQLRPDPAKAYRDRMRAAETGQGEFWGLGPLTKAKIQATIERALLIRQRRLTEAGDLHKASACRHRRLRQIHAVKGALLALPRSVSASLAGQGRDGIERVLQERVVAILAEFAAGEADEKPRP